MKVKLKEFRSPSEEPVRVVSDDFRFIAYVESKWGNLREECWRDAYSKGCVSKDMAVKGMSEEQTLAAMKAEEVQEREEYKKVMVELINEGDPEKLDANGKPKISAIADVLGVAPLQKLRNEIFKEIVK